MKSLFVAVLAVFSAFYLLNPTAGMFELIPDVIPVIGNIDEVTMTAVLVACMRYFGFDISRLFGSRESTAMQYAVNKRK